MLASGYQQYKEHLLCDCTQHPAASLQAVQASERKRSTWILDSETEGSSTDDVTDDSKA